MDPPIIIVGCGPGDPAWLPAASRRRIEAACMIAGAPHLLAWFPEMPGIPFSGSITRFLDALETASRTAALAVLVTGDPGCFSLTQSVLGRFGLERCQVLPGISALQLAFARVGEPWHDAELVSLHGRAPELEPEAYRGRSRLAFFLDGRKTGLGFLEALARSEPVGYRWVLCEDLSWPEERVAVIDPQTLRKRTLASRSLLLRLRDPQRMT